MNAARHSRLAFPAMFLLLLVASGSRGAVIDVGLAGPGAGCEANSLLSAIALAAGTSAADEIRMHIGEILDDTLVFTDWNANTKGALTISGGWTDCNDTTPDDALLIGIQFDIEPTGILVNATAGSPGSFLTLKRIEVLGSTARGIRVENNGTVLLQRAGVNHNDGGGVRVLSGGYLHVDAESWIELNGGPLVDGGGIQCSGPTSEVVVDGHVQSNEGDQGGGILVGSGCQLTLANDGRVEYNEATHGGGLYVSGGGIVGASPGANVNSNSATSSGGGIFAEGVGAQVQLLGTSVSANDAGFAGGGIYVSASAVVTLDGGGSCPGSTVCASGVWSNELLAGGQDGVAGYAANGGKLRLYQTSVRYNTIDEGEPVGSVLHASGAGAEVVTESVVVWFNTGPASVFQSTLGGLVHAAFTTAALNRYQGDGGLVDAIGMRVGGAGSIGRINSSIFYSTGGYYAHDGGAFSQVDCLITSTTTGLPAGATEVFLDNPGYVDLLGGNVRVGPMSPAVDFCDSFFYPPAHSDLEGRARNRDIPANPDGFPGPGGRHDVGAYEYQDIFSDGFASGNTSAWTLDFP